MIRHYLKIAWRSLNENRFRNLFTAMNLALAMIVVSLALYIIIQGKRSYTQFEHHRRIASISYIDTVSGDIHPYKSNHITDLLQKRAVTGVSKVAFFNISIDQVDLEKGDDLFLPYMCKSALVNRDFFHVFSSVFIAGNVNTWNERSAVITTRFSEKVYGKENPIGKTISNGVIHYKITGVIEPYTPFGIVSADIFFPLNDFIYNGGYVLLEKEADISQVNQTLSGIKSADNDSVFKLRKIYEPEKDNFGNIMMILMIIISIMILMVAFINFMNLSISGLLSRIREVSLRKTVGAQSNSIRLWAIMSDLFLLLLSLLIAVSLVELITHIVNTRGVDLNITGLWIESQYLFTSLISIFAVVLICFLIFINIAVSGINMNITMQGIHGSLMKGKRHRIRNTLLVVQLAICFLFTGITLGLQRQYKETVHAYLQSRNIENLESSRILELNLGTISSMKYWNNREAIIDEIEGIKEIESILYTYFSLFPYKIEVKRNPDDQSSISALYSLVDKNYFSFFDLDDQGVEEMGEQQTILVINEALARLLNEESNQNSFYWNNSFVNVHRVINSLPLFPDDQPGFVQISNDQYNQFDIVYLKFMPGKKAVVERQIGEIMEKYVPSYPVQTESLKQKINSRSGNIIVPRDIFLIVSLFTLIISMFGIYSAIITDTQQREKEVAIRKVNGAKVMDILHLFGMLYLKLMLLSFIIILPLLLFALKFFSSMVNSDISILNVTYWVQLIIIVGGFVFITVILRMWRTANINPATIIKKD